MITIKNIEKIESRVCYGRVLSHITKETNQLGEHYYCFHFMPQGDGQRWNKHKEVRLCRDKTIGKESYAIFVMGLASTTQMEVFPKELRDINDIVIKISLVLSVAKKWWDNAHPKT